MAGSANASGQTVSSPSGRVLACGHDGWSGAGCVGQLGVDDYEWPNDDLEGAPELGSRRDWQMGAAVLGHYSTAVVAPRLTRDSPAGYELYHLNQDPWEIHNIYKTVPRAQQQQAKGLVAWFQSLRQQNREGKNRLAALGLAAVLAYGLFDGISYTTAFSIAFLGYEARTGLNPTQNVADLVKICVLMWAGNNVTRPFRIAGAAGLAPFMDRLMDRLQARLGLPQKFYAFLLITLAVAATCLSIVGTLFVSRLVRG
ncbi:hypothetical protein N2152v2_010559 [Parachlorella kessleri]